MDDEAEHFSIDFNDCGETEMSFAKPHARLSPPVINVYLASAMTCLPPELQEEGKRARYVIKKLFENFDCNGLRFRVYDPAEVTPPGSDHTDQQVYQMDHHQTASSDVVVFYVLNGSLGMGMEAQISADCTLPRVVIHRGDFPISRMFGGAFNPTLARIAYDNVDDLEKQLSESLVDICIAAVHSATQRRLQLENFNADAVGRQIQRLRIQQGLTLESMARETDIAAAWLREIELSPARSATLTLVQLSRIATALRTTIKIGDTGNPTISNQCEDQQPLSEDESAALESLLDCLSEDNFVVDEHRVLDCWREYVDESRSTSNEAVRYRNKKVITPEGWKKRLRELF